MRPLERQSVGDVFIEPFPWEKAQNSEKQRLHPDRGSRDQGLRLLAPRRGRGKSKQSTMRNSVVLPQPLGPKDANTLVCLDVEINVVQRDNIAAAVCFRQISNDDLGHAGIKRPEFPSSCLTVCKKARPDGAVDDAMVGLRASTVIDGLMAKQCRRRAGPPEARPVRPRG